MPIMGNEGTIALSLLAAAETAHAFSSFLPSYFTIKSFALDGSPEQVSRKLVDLRSGYAPAIGFGLALGGIVSYLAKSPWPLALSGAAAAFMVTQYEGALPSELRYVGLLPGVRPALAGGNTNVF